MTTTTMIMMWAANADARLMCYMKGVLNGTIHQRCAVVYSSGSVLDERRGPEIDAHDAIIRFNDAPTRGFGEYVGVRTTYRFANYACSRQLAFPTKGPCAQIWNVAGAEIFLTAARRLPAKSTKRCDRLRTTDHFGLEGYAAFANASCGDQSHTPMTGLKAVLAALELCRRVDVFGASESLRYHYYDDTHITPTHDPHCERRFLRRSSRLFFAANGTYVTTSRFQS
ncbi:hypothetical protein CTAYLR_003804 [Chrysophaeum taylorii]|uniref:Uncharacterized protein n=1 Tax=Chrysophaeum taylorii TaxID=2483200 RepID=A0AAD7UDL3_9STRA|nr:hypothetical protein CTAYLR_003804 [Chrysophaeum taylorii]